MKSNLLVAAACVHLMFAGVLLALPASAADLGGGSEHVPDRAQSTPAQTQARTENHIERLAALELLRAAFDVIPAPSIPEILGNELQRLGGDGPTETDLAALDLDLLAECSYYIVSLRYLIESGGSLWPGDRPQHFYVNDALVELRAAQQDLLAAVEARSDPLPLLSRINRIHAWTEGHAAIPPRFDFFSLRDDLVEAAMVRHGPQSAA